LLRHPSKQNFALALQSFYHLRRSAAPARCCCRLRSAKTTRATTLRSARRRPKQKYSSPSPNFRSTFHRSTLSQSKFRREILQP
jgi:hypothetical protein